MTGGTNGQNVMAREILQFEDENGNLGNSLATEVPAAQIRRPEFGLPETHKLPGEHGSQTGIPVWKVGQRKETSHFGELWVYVRDPTSMDKVDETSRMIL